MKKTLNFDNEEQQVDTSKLAEEQDSAVVLKPQSNSQSAGDVKQAAVPDPEFVTREINGPKGLEPTRYGDWESKGRCHDF